MLALSGGDTAGDPERRGRLGQVGWLHSSVWSRPGILARARLLVMEINPSPSLWAHLHLDLARPDTIKLGILVKVFSDRICKFCCCLKEILVLRMSSIIGVLTAVAETLKFRTRLDLARAQAHHY